MGLGSTQACQLTEVIRRRCKALTALDLTLNRDIKLSVDHWANLVVDLELAKLDLGGSGVSGSVAALAACTSLKDFRAHRTEV